MTQTTKEIFEKYQVRKSKDQKTAFIQYVQQVAENYGYAMKIEKGSFGTRNIVIGDPDTAKVLYTAHYDTCAKSFFPNFITPKNFSLYLVGQLAVVAIALGVAYLLWLLLHLLLPLFSLPEAVALSIERIVPEIGLITFLLLLICGPANKVTANDNTSGVTTVLDIMKELPQDQRSKVAFVLFDLEEAGVFGAFSFASKHKELKKNAFVVNFDCVSDGETMMFGLKKSTLKYAELLKKAFVSNEDVTVDIDRIVFYPSDNTAFKGGIGVASLRKTKGGILYIDKIHTKKDVVYREENIRFLTDGAVKLAQLL